eukprot:15357239-Ditylum_brightwellii.AAC.2
MATFYRHKIIPHVFGLFAQKNTLSMNTNMASFFIIYGIAGIACKPLHHIKHWIAVTSKDNILYHTA